MSATRQLHDLGQSLWLDNITRGLLTSGTLARYIRELAVTGLTSNPTIFDHAIKNAGTYDDAIRKKTEDRQYELGLPARVPEPRLCQLPPRREIAARMISVVPAITNLLDKLEKRGWVRRERCDSDRRVWHVHLTEDGSKLLDELDEPNLAMHERLVGHLTATERTQLLALLEKARASVATDEAR